MQRTLAEKEIDVVGSFDLDNTILITRDGKFSPTTIRLFKAAQKADIPCFITTARHLRDLVCSVLNKLQDKKLTLEDITIFLEASSFENVIKRLNELGIETPTISTYLDPCELKGKQGLYYKNYDKVSNYLIRQINNVIDGQMVRDQLSSLLKEMLTALQVGAYDSQQNDQGNFIRNIDPEILALLYYEHQLFSEFSLFRLAEQYKFHQFLWIQKRTSCRRIIHLDDYNVIYNACGVTGPNDFHINDKFKVYYQTSAPWLKSEGSDSVIVCCVPFDHHYRPDKSESTMLKGLNSPITEIIAQLKNIQWTCWPLSCCFFRIDPRERQSAGYIETVLSEALVRIEEYKEEELTDMSDESKRPFIKKQKYPDYFSEEELYLSPRLQEIVKQVPGRAKPLLRERNIVIDSEEKGQNRIFSIKTENLESPGKETGLSPQSIELMSPH
jgi:haloacid dehalogenase-like hydrolase